MTKTNRKAQADDFARRFMASGVEYTCGAVVMSWVGQQPDFDGYKKLRRMTWDRVHALRYPKEAKE